MSEERDIIVSTPTIEDWKEVCAVYEANIGCSGIEDVQFYVYKDRGSCIYIEQSGLFLCYGSIEHAEKECRKVISMNDWRSSVNPLGKSIDGIYSEFIYKE